MTSPSVAPPPPWVKCYGNFRVYFTFQGILLLRGQSKCLQYKSLIEPSCVNALAQI